MRRVFTFSAGLLLVIAASLAAQESEPTAQQPKTLRVGIALPVNLSSQSFSTVWIRNELVRSIELLQQKKQDVNVVPVPLKSDSFKNAARECKEQQCESVILVTVRDLGPGVSSETKGGISQDPVTLGPLGDGGGISTRAFVAQFEVRRLGDPRKVGEGAMSVPPSNNPQDSLRQTLDIMAANMVRTVQKHLPLN